MNFNNSIDLDKYAESANKELGDMRNRLSEIKSSFGTRMDGQTAGGTFGSLLGSILWLAAYLFGAYEAKTRLYMFNTGYYYGSRTVENICLYAAVGVMALLLLFMIIDALMRFSYYGRLSSHRGSVTQLMNRVDKGISSIGSHQEIFKRSKLKGWDYNLKIASSIPEEALCIEETMKHVSSLKRGFANGAKNFFFFTAAVVVTVAECIALFPTGNGIIMGISGESFSSGTLLTFSIIGTVIAVIGEIILAKLAWSGSDCSVTNVTLFILLLGPVIFLAITALVTSIVMLVILIIPIVIYVLAIIFVLACICGSSSD